MESISVKAKEAEIKAEEKNNKLKEENVEEEEKEKQPIFKKCSIFPQVLVICLVLFTLLIFSYWALYAILSEKPGMQQSASESGIMTEVERRRAFDEAWDSSMNVTLNAMKTAVSQFANCYAKRHARISTALLRWFTCMFIGNPPRTCLRAFVLNFSPCFDPTLEPKEQTQLVDEFVDIVEQFHRSSGEFISSIIPYSTCFVLHQKDIFHDTLECARYQIPRERKDTTLPTICNALDTISTCIIGGYQKNCDSIALSFAKTFVHGDATRNWSRKYIWKCPQKNVTADDFTIST